MTINLKTIIFKIMLLTGLPFLRRKFFQKKKVTILLFHEFPDKMEGEKIISFLKNNYSLITLDELHTALESREKWDKLPSHPCLITFDDGRVSNSNLIPLIKKYKFESVIYVSTDKSRLDGEKFFTSGDLVRYKTFLNFQAHTQTHPRLTEIDRNQAYSEIQGGRNMLEAMIEMKVDSFAYPYGYYNDEHAEICKNANFKSAMTVDYGENGFDQDKFKLKRICLSDNPTITEVIVKSSGILKFLN